MRILLAATLCALLAACAHSQKPSGLEGLKPIAEGFHRLARWKDYRGAASFIVPERRAAFERARANRDDDTNLSITDYELEDVVLLPDGRHALVLSRMSWTRLPSVSVNTDTVTSEFVWRDGTWLLARQERGPFAELSLPYEDPPAPPHPP